ncbi:MAG TPA: hypothetical protein DCP90_02525 [Clostridiales bacterium]|nr:MAG: hypothetical protein A2Y22_03845 [Clostridiales bacterium GWD2_32_59]HAN09468.1 hypothetical protein [Clostridiales bacterium]
MIEKIGKWWGGNSKTKKQEEIDIVAIGEDSIILGECKYRKEKTDIDILEDLIRKGEIFNYKNKYYYIFSKGGFTIKLQRYAEQNDNIRLVEDIIIGVDDKI